MLHCRDVYTVVLWAEEGAPSIAEAEEDGLLCFGLCLCHVHAYNTLHMTR